MSKKLNGSIELTMLNCVRMKTPKGAMGTFIPDELGNNVEIVKSTKEGVETERAFVAIVVWINDEENERGQIASIKQSLPSGTYKKIKEEKGKDEANKISNDLPYLGNLKDFSSESSNTSNVAAPGVFSPESDDLPF